MRDRVTKNSEEREGCGVVQEERGCCGVAGPESAWPLKSGTPKTESFIGSGTLGDLVNHPESKLPSLYFCSIGLKIKDTMCKVHSTVLTLHTEVIKYEALTRYFTNISLTTLGMLKLVTVETKIQ